MTQSNKIKIAIVDDHEIFRAGLKSHLSIYKDLDIVINAENANDLLASLDNQPVDVILLDISLPDINGIEIAKIIREKDQNIKILMLTGHDQSSYVFNSLDAKANGYLIKTSKASEIYNAIKTVIIEGSYFNEFVKNIIASDVIRKHQNEFKENNNVPTFSGIEMKVLGFIRDGKTSEAIGKKLFKSKRTIDEYRSQLMKKTNTHNSTELMYYCIANKIFDSRS
ncbi:MAG: response regulator transcription factor [Bacteroidota bacterium]|nr:response regulator transcription factor [Bacteroidota bacterium]